jgi:hypothetical protein
MPEGIARPALLIWTNHGNLRYRRQFRTLPRVSASFSTMVLLGLKLWLNGIERLLKFERAIPGLDDACLAFQIRACSPNRFPMRTDCPLPAVDRSTWRPVCGENGHGRRSRLVQRQRCSDQLRIGLWSSPVQASPLHEGCSSRSSTQAAPFGCQRLYGLRILRNPIRLNQNQSE